MHRLALQSKPILLLLLLSCIAFFGTGWRTTSAVVSLGGARDVVCESYLQGGDTAGWKKCVEEFKCGDTQTNDKNGVKFCNPRFSCAQHCNNVVDDKGKISQCCYGGPSSEKLKCRGGVGKLVNGKYSCDISSGPPTGSPSSPPNSGESSSISTVPEGCAFFNGKVQCAQMDSGSKAESSGGLPNMMSSWVKNLSDAFGLKQPQQPDAFNRSGEMMSTFTQLERMSSLSDLPQNENSSITGAGYRVVSTHPLITVPENSDDPRAGFVVVSTRPLITVPSAGASAGEGYRIVSTHPLITVPDYQSWDHQTGGVDPSGAVGYRIISERPLITVPIYAGSSGDSAGGSSASGATQSLWQSMWNSVLRYFGW